LISQQWNSFYVHIVWKTTTFRVCTSSSFTVYRFTLFRNFGLTSEPSPFSYRPWKSLIIRTERSISHFPLLINSIFT
jgi:hypothetical protein